MCTNVHKPLAVSGYVFCKIKSQVFNLTPFKRVRGYLLGFLP